MFQNWNFLSYPYIGSGVSKSALNLIVSDMRAAIDAESIATSTPKLSFSLSMSPQPYVVNDAYNMTLINRCVFVCCVLSYCTVGAYTARLFVMK
jgi:malic enzyme